MRSTRIMHPLPPDIDPERLRSEVWLQFFVRVLTHRLRRSFHAVRLAKPGVPAVSDELPLVIYCESSVVVGRGARAGTADETLSFTPQLRARSTRSRCSAMDSCEGWDCSVSRRVRMKAHRCSFASAVRSCRSPDTLFYLTPQGRFTDVRDRPVRLRPGLAHLLSRVPRVTVLPLAVEYPFWDESAPEALVRFGEPMMLGSSVTSEIAEIQELLQARLSQAMDCLAEAAVSRDAARFDILLDGRAGVGGVYDGWRRLRAWRRGEKFDPAHVPGEQGVMKQST